MILLSTIVVYEVQVKQIPEQVKKDLEYKKKTLQVYVCISWKNGVVWDWSSGAHFVINKLIRYAVRFFMIVK